MRRKAKSVMKRANSRVARVAILIFAVLAFVVLACTPQPSPGPFVDYDATVSAIVAASEQSPTPTPNIQATVDTAVDATKVALIPTPNPTATVEAGAADVASSGDSETTTVEIGTATPVVPPTPTQEPFTEVNFSGYSYTTNVPYQIQVTFGLRDQNERAIVKPPEEVAKGLSLFERESGETQWEEIDLLETNYFVHTAENIDLEVVFVLDFTESMRKQRMPNGDNGIEAMLSSFGAAIDVLSPTHRIGVVEFHDRDFEPKILSTLTSNRETIRGNVAEFSESQFDPGFSRVWDAVVKGMGLFTNNRRTVRALVFLSDGRDNASVSELPQITSTALGRDIRMYALGIGEVTGESDLRSLASRTGGGYHPVRDVSGLQNALQIVVSDLRGQYQVTYITSETSGQHETQLAIELNRKTDTLKIGPYRVDSFAGPSYEGIISVDPPLRDTSEGTTTYFVRARHMPRNIDTLRFKIGGSEPAIVSTVARADGGLLSGWDLKQAEDGYLEATSSEPVEFGNFGLLFKVTIPELADAGEKLDLEFDNSIYGETKKLKIVASP